MLVSTSIDRLTSNPFCYNKDTEDYFVVQCRIVLSHKNEFIVRSLLEVVDKEHLTVHSLLLPTVIPDSLTVDPPFLGEHLGMEDCSTVDCGFSRKYDEYNLKMKLDGEMRAFNLFVSRAFMVVFEPNYAIKEVVEVTNRVMFTNGIISLENARFPDAFDLMVEFSLEKTNNVSTLTDKVNI